MRLTYYGYNAFIVEGEGRTIFLDPGQDLHWRSLGSLIPRARWAEADLILVTHGDADHAEYVSHVARTSRAPVICGQALADTWRRRGVAALPIVPGEGVEAAGVEVLAAPVQHGPLVRLLGRTLTLPFVGRGGVALLFTLEGHRLLNLGDTLLVEEGWQGLHPAVLMVPIGGMMTMDVDDALRAAEIIEPRTVIPMHYDWHILVYHRPADVGRFVDGVEKLGCQCLPLGLVESVELQVL